MAKFEFLPVFTDESGEKHIMQESHDGIHGTSEFPISLPHPACGRTSATLYECSYGGRMLYVIGFGDCMEPIAAFTASNLEVVDVNNL